LGELPLLPPRVGGGDCIVLGGATLAVQEVGVAATLDEERDDVDVAGLRGEHDRRRLARVERVHRVLAAVLEQRP